MRKNIILLLALICAGMADAKVRLPQLFQSGMVMQRGQSVPVWGMADAGEQVKVFFKNKVYETTADDAGRWQVMLPKQKAGGPYELKVNDVSLSDVLFGDVWLCSGQSNIDVTIERVYPQYGQLIDDYSNENIRMFRVQTDYTTHGPKQDIRPSSINWKPVNKQNAWLFSAVGYFLGREMYQKTGVPQGVIVNSLGGTPIQAWLPSDTIRQYYPMDYSRLRFYQDDEMARALSQANQQASNRWQQLMDENDPGLKFDYTARNFDDSQWKVKQQYDNLTGSPYYNGSFWVRQHVHIDAAHAGKSARMLLGTLYDADYTYVNGKEVGRTYYQYPPRRYQIPEGVLKEGDNALIVRFITKGEAPHFIKEKPYKLIFGDGTELPLSTEWRVHEGVQMPRLPQADAGGQNLPSVLYNAMLYPLAPYALSGIVWYQGESNTGDGAIYGQMLTQLINGWRQLWQAPQLPFVVVQLANFMEASDKPQNSGWSMVREAQRLTAEKLPQTELAVIIDLGEAVDIHPLRKWEVARRIALNFDHMLWNKKAPLSPRVMTAEVNGGRVVLTLDQTLRSDGVLHEFELAGADGCFVNAEAVGFGNQIVVTSSSVLDPRMVRYAWKNNPARADVYSKDNLPMSPFQKNL